MDNRAAAKSRSKKVEDPYLFKLDNAWPTILRAYGEFKHLRPIIEYDVQEGRVYAYPAQRYLDALTDRTREQARQVYADAVAARKFMVFLRDTRERVFRSYVFPIERP